MTLKITRSFSRFGHSVNQYEDRKRLSGSTYSDWKRKLTLKHRIKARKSTAVINSLCIRSSVWKIQRHSQGKDLSKYRRRFSKDTNCFRRCICNNNQSLLLIFLLSMQLPCHHILKLREVKDWENMMKILLHQDGQESTISKTAV